MEASKAEGGSMSDEYNKQSILQAGVVAYITKLKIPNVLKSFP